MAEQYLYSTLPSDQHIRLLDLSPGQFGEPITCSLQIVAVDKTQPYAALSYTWGEPTLNHSILCDGKELKITSNLHDALQRLRLSDGHRLMWADAICINQSNIYERGEQVRLMRFIYSHADETVVFLGEAGEEAKLAFELGQKILDLRGSVPAGVKITPDCYESYGLPPSQSKAWDGLGRLYSLPWFCRIWIIQEFALSRHPSFRWGETAFAFDFLVQLGQETSDLGLHYDFLQAVREYSKHDPGRLFGKIRWMKSMLQCKTRQDGFPSLLMLLDRYLIKESTDPKDQVYALLGISNKPNEPDLLPNYTLDIRQTYGHACRWLLTQAPEGPGFLHLVGLPRSHSQLPSWVPDFSTIKTTTPLTGGSVSFDAGGSSEMNWRVSEDLSVLIAHGAVVDVVDECLSDLLAGISDKAEENIALRFKFYLESFRLTLRSAGDPDLIEAMKRHKSTIFFDVDPGVESEIMLSTYVVADSSLAVICNTDTEWIQPSVNVILKAAALNTGWKFCLTKSGRVGQIPAESVPGDKVCIFPGMKTPFIARKQETDKNSFFLIGECFVNGLMYGEAMNLEDFQVQEIRLI